MRWTNMHMFALRDLAEKHTPWEKGEVYAGGGLYCGQTTLALGHRRAILMDPKAPGDMGKVQYDKHIGY